MQQPTSDMLTRLQSTDPAVREQAMHELSATHDREALSALMEVYKSDPDPRLRQLAIDTAKQIQANANQSGGGTTAKPAGPVAPVPGNAMPIQQPPTGNTPAGTGPGKIVSGNPLTGVRIGNTPVNMSFNLNKLLNGQIPIDVNLSSGQRHQVGMGASPVSATGNKTYQMLWDCRFCGSTKLLGITHRFCPNCGAAQNPEWRYYPSDADKKTIDDPNYKYAGIDKECPFCHQPNSAAALHCTSCGGDLANAKPVTLKEKLEAGSVADTGHVEDLVMKKYQAEQAVIKAKARKRVTQRVLIGVAVLIALLVGGFLFLTKSTYGTNVQVTDTTWQRVVSVEQLNPVTGVNWQSQVPLGAYGLSCYAKQRPVQRSEEYECGTTRTDNGDGSFSESPKYCTRNITDYVADTECTYTVDTWQHEKDLTTTGGQNDPLIYSDFTPLRTSGIGAERSTQSQNFNVVFADQSKDAGGKTYTYTTQDEAKWRTFKVGQTYVMSINRLNVVQWDTLKLVSSGGQ